MDGHVYMEGAPDTLVAGDDSDIDYSDIPELSDEQLANFRPARDFEQFRRWQDQHRPELVPAFEEARRRWHERHDQEEKR